MEVIIPVGYSFFQKTKYSNPKLQKLVTLKHKNILYDKANDPSVLLRTDEDNLDKNWAFIFSNMLESQTITLE